MSDAFESLLMTPTAARYLAAREALLNDPEFRATSEVIATLEQLYADDRFPELGRLIDERLPDLKLSARVHYLAGQVAQRAGRPDLVELEQFAMQACLTGLLATGDGSPELPYEVTYASDPTDVLAARRIEARTQSLTRVGARWLDVITCRDGTQRWFDVTLLRRAEALAPPRSTVGT